MEELGFGISNDKSTWAILVEAEKGPYQTKAGREFQKELLKISLEEVIWQARRDTDPAAENAADVA
jgi:hypothetical protein